jgi:uncharacterized membrane protein (DUF2068 family)
MSLGTGESVPVDSSPESEAQRSAALPSAPGRRHRKVDWELISCATKGHALVGTDAAEVRPDDYALVREASGLRWHRCLRCDAWLPLGPPSQPARPSVPALDEVEIPLRGRPLRDRYVLRLIAVERAIHVLVFALLAVAIFIFIPHRNELHSDYTQFLQNLRNGIVGPNAGRRGFWTLINRLFSISETDLILIGVVLVLYCVLLSVEIVGLWRARRWAEYLTFVESCVLLPYEFYELTKSVTVLKVAGLIFNLAILLYLAIVHRLFGIRGGHRAIQAAYEAHGGRQAFDRATPAPPA